MKLRLFTFLALFGVAVAPVSLFAQSAEINPYGGYVWPNDFTGIGDFKGNQILGVRGGGYIGNHFEIGGNYSWNNHFQPTNTNLAAHFAGDRGFPQGAVRANLWEAEFTYHFAKHNMFGSSVRPYLVAGGGGLTTTIKNEDEFVFNVRPTRPNGNGTVVFVPNDVLESGNTFFTFSYGGGVKTSRLWGPMGLFGDFRGRTVPNFFGHANTWPELSAGLHFSWGE